MDSKYGEGDVVQIVCHLFVTAALSSTLDGLIGLLLLSFRFRAPRKHFCLFPSFVLQFSVCRSGQADFSLFFFFFLMFYNKVKGIMYAGLDGKSGSGSLL